MDVTNVKTDEENQQNKMHRRGKNSCNKEKQSTP